MAIDRGPWNALVDDDGSNLTGSIWNKAAIKTVILDPADAAYQPIVAAFTPVDTSGAGLVFGFAQGTSARFGRVVTIAIQVVYPATANASPAAIGGLPAAVAAPGAGGVAAYGAFRTWYLPAGGTSLQPIDPTSGAMQTNAQLSGANLIVTATYITT
jgi:hypothetical protein